MFYLASYDREDKLQNILEFNKLPKVMEEVKISSDVEIDKFEIFADEWKNHHLTGKVMKSGSVDWVKEDGWQKRRFDEKSSEHE